MGVKFQNNCEHSFIYSFKNQRCCYFCHSRVKEKCDNCKGLGEIVCYHPFNEYEESLQMCQECNGSGLKG